jgi:hypothetical protein
MSTHTWQFAPRFKRNGFGWKSEAPIQRIKEALTEIRQTARKEPELAAEGAIVLLQKLAPALMQVDSSSGALGAMVNRAIEALVPILAKPKVEPVRRQRWLDRLWQAIDDDEMPYIESLAEFWGELCVTPEVASVWADRFLPTVQQVWSPAAPGYGHFKGTTACLSALYTAGRHEELLALLETARFKWWLDRRWGVKALVALGRKSEALRYAEASRGLNQPDWQIAQVCEEILLTSGLSDEAYGRYAIEANQSTTNLATFRAIAKKYPHKEAADILLDLVRSQPGAEGKWFAAAKDAGLFDAAIALALRSPTDPRTLTRAARDYATERPDFAMAAGMAALHWIAAGHGYEITGADVFDAYQAVLQAARCAGVEDRQVQAQVRTLIAQRPGNAKFMSVALARQLPN